MTTMQKVFGFENAKTTKGESLGWVTAIRYLAPSTESGWNVCPNAGACRDVCLYTAGRGAFKATQDARIAKTLWRRSDKKGHLDAASQEIEAAERKASKVGMGLAVRVNGTSDLPGDAFFLARKHPAIQFYDYTKILGTALRDDLPKNYHVTLSFDAQTVPWGMCEHVISRGVNVAVVFDKVPEHFKGYRVIDGDAHDLRFLDPKGVVVGLKAKGAARRDTSGFVVKGES